MQHLTNDFYNEHFFASYEICDNTPFCLRTGDSYYHMGHGLAERRSIYLEQETLFDAFFSSGRSVFTMAEIGFGTGLTFLAALHHWKLQKTRNSQKTLLYISMEQYPFSPEGLADVLQLWEKELPEEIAALKERYKILTPGINILPFLKYNVFLIILVGPAEETLQKAHFFADHWCYDGFSPAKNPSAWSESLMKQITRLSHNQTTLSSFSSASAVRHQLAHLGWDVLRVQGFRYKAHRIRAILRKGTPRTPPKSSVFRIAGSGIAGLSIAYFRSCFNEASILLDDRGPKASLAPHIYLTPKIHRSFDRMTQFNLQSYFFAGAFYRDLSDISGLAIEEGHAELFDSNNRTHRLFQELLQSRPAFWEKLVDLKRGNGVLCYPYSISGSGAEICELLASLSKMTMEYVSLKESLSEQSPDALACSWGAQLWGADYLPSSILRGEMHPLSEKRWSSSTHERHAFNPNSKVPRGFVGFRTQLPSHLPFIQYHPIYASLHHGSRGFTSGPWYGILIALSSLGLFEYQDFSPESIKLSK